MSTTVQSSAAAASTAWPLLGPNLAGILRHSTDPLRDLADGRVAALVFRRAIEPAETSRLIAHLIARELLYDPALPVPAKFVEESVPEGFYRKGKAEASEKGLIDTSATARRRIDIGSSLGYLGSNKEQFLQHAEGTRRLFDGLFDGFVNPIALLYGHLASLAPGKSVITAREPDGRCYGPAIVRAHYGGYTYKPHFDSVRLREDRTDYAVFRFEHQFAGVLVLQNASLGDQTAQCILHRCPWRPELDVHIKEDTFHQFARESGVANVTVVLEPGDLYFFNTRMIHEVPGVAGPIPRIVLATFIGYSPEDGEVFVWS